MNPDLKDILNNSNKDFDNQKLMDYLSRQLSKADSHELEKAMNDDDFMNDAVEGLQEFKDVNLVPISVEQLNNDLQKKLAVKKNRKGKRKIKETPYVYFTIVLMLLLIVLAYVVIKMHFKQ